MSGRVEEAEAELVDRPRDPLRGQLERETQSLEHVGRTRSRRDRPVAVLRDAGPRSSCDQGGGGRDVDRARPVASGAGGVDEIVALWPNGEDVLPDRLREAGDLVRRLALDPQRDEEAADLSGRRFAGHDRAHGHPRVLAREVAAVE